MATTPRQTKPRILVVEDDAGIGLLAKTALEAEGYLVQTCELGKAALSLIRKSAPDLLVLDLNLPDLDGREICRELRGRPQTESLPILMMTSLSSTEDRVRGFELGADDYLPKPVSYRELVLRIRALLKRTRTRVAEPTAARLEVGCLTVDLDRREVLVEDKPVVLTTTEFRLLTFLIEQTGKVVNRQQLLERVWETRGDLETRRVDTFVQRLRKKLGAAGKFLHTHRGDGYRFES